MGKKKNLRSRTVDDHSNLPTSSSSNTLKTVTFDGSARSPKKNGGSGDYFMKPSGKGLRASPSINTLNRLERQNIVLWKRPLQTIYFATRESTHLFNQFLYYLWQHSISVLLFLFLLCSFCWVCKLPGWHQPYIDLVHKHGLTSCSWIGLGILSSVGLGFGLHTFLLYLGPFIAQVTVAAYVCQSLDFPEPPYPNQVICPESSDSGNAVNRVAVTMWAIMSKVRWESLCWGAGTALGELPPYFMAKAAKLSGEEPDDEEYREYMAYIKAIEKGTKPSLMKRLKLRVEKFMTGLIHKIGFLGILICASIPNPLFDLAGITCGYLLIPFWTFFGATLIGKALIKMHLQMFAVVLAFSDQHLNAFLHHMGEVPYVGAPLQNMLQKFFENQKKKLRSKHMSEGIDTLQQLFSVLIGMMFGYFVISIINSLAQRWHKRLCAAEMKKSS